MYKDKEKRKQYALEYYRKNREKCSKKGQEYYQKHREEILARKRRQYEEHPIEKIAKTTEYYRQHSKELYKKKREGDVEPYRKYQREYWRNRRKDPQFKRDDARRAWNRRMELFNKLGGKCVRCGETDPRLFDIHHKNGRQNGRYEYYPKTPINELELLCVKCHRLEHWEHGKFREIWRQVVN